MTLGDVATDRLKSGTDWVPGLHSLGDLNPIDVSSAKTPETRHLGVGLGYGGNALAGKCLALRIASTMGRTRLAGRAHAHPRSPDGDHPHRGAFSACGKTNLAMLRPFEREGWKV